jgi:hypothetical protein
VKQPSPAIAVDAARADRHRNAAIALIEHYGEQATSYAVYRALRARNQGDARSEAAWQRLADVIRVILRTEPESA